MKLRKHLPQRRGKWVHIFLCTSPKHQRHLPLPATNTNLKLLLFSTDTFTVWNNSDVYCGKMQEVIAQLILYFSQETDHSSTGPTPLLVHVYDCEDRDSFYIMRESLGDRNRREEADRCSCPKEHRGAAKYSWPKTLGLIFSTEAFILEIKTTTLCFWAYLLNLLLQAFPPIALGL